MPCFKLRNGMAIKIKKTYGKLHFDKEANSWIISDAQPHVCIKLKNIFTRINPTKTASFSFQNKPEVCHDLVWFTSRYPLEIQVGDLNLLKKQNKLHIKNVNDIEQILLPNSNHSDLQLKNGRKARQYQLQYNQLFLKIKRILNGDDIGLGKTLEAILGMLNAQTRPCIVTVQTHLPKQWQEEIEYYTDLKVHIIKGTRPYNLPPADVYITKYSCLAGWVDIFRTGFFKSAVFDEIQELRHDGSNKYNAAKVLSDNVEYLQGLSASPIYNYGIEIFNIMQIIKPGALGLQYEFMREWCGYSWRVVEDPKALGTFLRENFLMIRRTRKDVNRELPPINTIIQTVGYDEAEVQKAEELAKILAIKAVSGSFTERGQASRELDILVRHNTGVAKAKGICEFVKILLENKVPIILAAWHRQVYDILLTELAQYKPVMYTGSETPAEKEKSKNAFINGDTDCFIISLRSGIGLDGLQERCNTVVIGELDWSGQVHNQIIGRARRETEADQIKDSLENKESVTVIYLVAECGSDPPMIDLLGIKAGQHEGIMNPSEAIQQQYSDESRIKLLAQQYLNKMQNNLHLE